MNIIFLRHGEAIDNVKALISDKEIYWSTLTKKGIKTVKESLESLPSKIDKIYVSPLPRTIETAHFVYELFPKTEVIIENRIREIYHGKYTHQENNEDLDNTRIKQINGDYFVRLGQYGENKYDIEERLCNFLKDLYQNNFKNNTIMIVSHGSITSYMKRILNIKSSHIQIGKIEVFKDIDFNPLFKHIKLLEKVKKEKIKVRAEKLKELNVNNLLKKNLFNMAKKEFNNIEISDEVFDSYIDGLKTNKLKCLTNPHFQGDIILICFYTDFENFADTWITHYLNIGITNFVLVDNNAKDKTKQILEKYKKKANISFWEINDEYNCNKMCGWKTQIFEFYGIGKIFITVDSDELLIYKDYRKIPLAEFIKKEKISVIKTLMLDVYTNKNLYEGQIADFKYVDNNTYKMTSTVYGNRFFGGPRTRLFGITPSLQKIPMMKYTGKEVFINDHFYYPWKINDKAKLCAYLLHYKFLPGDEKKYIMYAEDGRHWNNSREYKIYINSIKSNGEFSFYDEKNSMLIDDLGFKF